MSTVLPLDNRCVDAVDYVSGIQVASSNYHCRPPEGPKRLRFRKRNDQVKQLEKYESLFNALGNTAIGGRQILLLLPEVYAPELSATQLGVQEESWWTASDTPPAKQLRKDHPSSASGTGGKTLPRLSALITDVLLYIDAATVTSARENVGVMPTSDVAGSSQLETSEGSDDSFYELPALNSAEAKCWYVPRWNITNDSLLDDGFSCRTLVDRVAPWIFLYPPKEGSKASMMARVRLLEEKGLGDSQDLSIYWWSVAMKADWAGVPRSCTGLYGQVFALTGEVSVLKSTITQKDTDISLLDSRATYLKFALDRFLGHTHCLLTSEDFKEKAEAQQKEQAQVLYNRVAELEAHVMDVSGRLEGEFLSRIPYHIGREGKEWFLTLRNSGLL
ncbi:hypothetical protein Tco_0784917 [Tanacetum coccineum]